MLENNTCWFLAVDLDEKKWQCDAAAFIKTCQSKSVPYALEKSRSGNGAHIWVFFKSLISATQAIKMGINIIFRHSLNST